MDYNDGKIKGGALMDGQQWDGFYTSPDRWMIRFKEQLVLNMAYIFCDMVLGDSFDY